MSNVLNGNVNDHIRGMLAAMTRHVSFFKEAINNLAKSTESDSVFYGTRYSVLARQMSEGLGAADLIGSMVMQMDEVHKEAVSDLALTVKNSFSDIYGYLTMDSHYAFYCKFANQEFDRAQLHDADYVKIVDNLLAKIQTVGTALVAADNKPEIYDDKVETGDRNL